MDFSCPILLSEGVSTGLAKWFDNTASISFGLKFFVASMVNNEWNEPQLQDYDVVGDRIWNTEAIVFVYFCKLSNKHYQLSHQKGEEIKISVCIDNAPSAPHIKKLKIYRVTCIEIVEETN